MLQKSTIRLGLMMLMLLLLTGCAVKFIYNQLDWLIPWYLDDYVTLDPVQAVQFDAELENYLRWHRTQQLPEYADFLQWVAQASEDGFDRQEVDQIQLRSQAFADILFRRLGPSMVELLQQLTDEQIEEMYVNFAAENAEFREKYIEQKVIKQRYKRAKDIRRFIERWTGPLDDDQRQLIREWSQDYQLMGAEFIQSRVDWQARLKLALQKRDNESEFEAAVLEIFAQRRMGRTDSYWNKFEFNQQLIKQLYLDIDQSLSESQRQRSIGKLNAYAQDFRELAAQ
ncbi:MAG: DUF6279 family lipoprotein [Gammaproteobacteria bacterium]|nr:DUF6279 family lipoprotein [Gammaproteobacteria bacterium]